MFDNNYGNFPGQMYNGYGYAQAAPAQPPVFNQLLTAEEISKLQKSPQQFSTKLTDDEYLRSLCTHKNQHNQITLEKLPNNKYRCSICGAEFYLIDLNTSKEEIEQVCSNFLDVMQSIKTYYGNVPENLRDFYIMIGFINKIPYLWNVAKTYFEKVTNQNGMLQPNNDQSGFAMLGNIFGNGAMAGMANMTGMMPSAAGYYVPANQQAVPMPQAPMGGQPAPGYVYPQQPQMPNAAPGVNPALAPQMYPQMYPQQPQMQGYGMNPQNYMAPQPTVAMPGNPIGYVDPNARDFTNTAQPGPAVDAGTQAAPAMPEAPKNPNIKDANKATVTKQFAG